MNCYNHPEEIAVTKCIDCGKGLCKACATTYKNPICSECNMVRVQNEKLVFFMFIIPSILMFILGVVYTFYTASGNNWTVIDKILGSLAYGYCFAGIPWGWKLLSYFWDWKRFWGENTIRWWFGLPKFMVFPMHILLKLCASVFVGLVALPIVIIIKVVGFVKAKKKEEAILAELAKEQT
jgi:hypothetical protein